MPSQIVVIGAGIGGLSAAIQARLHGHDVLVLEQRESAGGKASSIIESGYRLDPGPSIVILTQIYDEIFRRAGRDMADYLRFERLDPFTRVFMGGHSGPIDLPANLDECLRILREVAPEDRESFALLMDQLDSVASLATDKIFASPIHKPWQMASLGMAKFARVAEAMKPYKEVIDARFKSPLLRAFFYGFPSYSGQSYRSPSPGSLLIPYFMIRHGVYWPVGGVGAIPAALYRLAVELGVEFRFGEQVTGLKIDGNHVRGVRTGKELIQASAVISNRDRVAVAGWLGPPSSMQPSYSYFTVHLGVRRRIPQFRHHTLFVPDQFTAGFEELYGDRQFPTRPIVYINETSDVDPSTAPEGCSNVFAVVTSPANEPQVNWATRTEEYAERVFAELRLHGIEFQPDEIEFTRIQTPLTFEERDGNYKGSLYGPDETHRLWGMMPLRCADERFKNLFYCGGSVQPGAGMPMVALSGKFASDLANR